MGGEYFPVPLMDLFAVSHTDRRNFNFLMFPEQRSPFALLAPVDFAKCWFILG